MLGGHGLTYTYTYDGLSRMASSGDGSATDDKSYVYDAMGRVVGRTLNPGQAGEVSQFFVYDNDRIVQELDGNGILVAAWDYGVYIDELLAMHRDTNGDGVLDTTYYYLQDDLYNVIGLTDASGNVLERYAYEDYGAPSFYTGAGRFHRAELFRLRQPLPLHRPPLG